MKPTDISRRTALKLAGGTAVTVVGASVTTLADDEEEQEDGEADEGEREGEEEDREELPSISFEDQTVESPTPTVTVAEVELPAGGWIVVHDWGTDGVTDDDDPRTNFVGVSTYLDAGEYENLRIELGGDRAVATPPSDGETHVVSAMVHTDDPDNRTFDYPNDVADGESPDDPAYTDDGEPVESFADVTFEA